MKQKVGFQFLGNEYYDYRSLTLAMARNWMDAVSIIDKESFLDYFAKNDPFTYGRMELEIKRCKYIETACSMAMYVLYPNDGVCISGRFFKSLKDIATCMYQNYPNQIKSIINFFKDRCVSHIFMPKNVEGLNDIEMDFIATIPFLEDNIENGFSYNYFMRFFFDELAENDGDQYTILDKFFRVVLKNSKESLKSVREITKNPDFLVVLARYYGVEAIGEFTKSNNYFFECINLIRNHVTFDVRDLMQFGYHIWLFNNFENYSYNTPKAVMLHKKYVKCLKDKKYLSNENFDAHFKNIENLYLLYQDFISLYVVGDITSTMDTYNINNAYNDTIVPSQYFADDGINAVLETVHYSKEDIMKNVVVPCGRTKQNKDEKKIRKIEMEKEKLEPINFRPIMTWRLVFGLCGLLIGAGALVWMILAIFVQKRLVVNTMVDYTLIASAVILIGLGIYVFVRSSKALSLLNQYFPKTSILDTASDLNPINQKKKEEPIVDIYKIESLDTPIAADFSAENAESYTETKVQFIDLEDNDKTKIMRSIYYKYEWFGAIISILVSYIAASFGYDILAGGSFVLSIINFESFLIFIAPVLTLILSFFRKFKSFAFMLVSVALSLVLIFGIGLILALI